jgi:cardiolipin synthase
MMDAVKRWWKPVLGVLGVLLAAFFFLVYQQVLTIVQKPSWPPGPDAITARGAQAATKAFLARSHKPSSVGVPYAWSTAATIEPWPDGTSFFPKIKADIEKATSTVDILMFGWREGQIGQQMTNLLIQKVKQGVEVRVIVDAAGSKPYGPASDMYHQLVAGGIQVVVNDTFPLDNDGLYPKGSIDWSQDDVGRADHRKLYVIDGKVAWIGGAGIEDHFANGKFFDVMSRVTGNVVLQAQSVFLMSFGAHDGPVPSDLSKFFPAQPDPGKIPIAIIQTVPGGWMSSTQAIRELIDHAKTRIDITNPYVTDQDMIQRLVAAAKRGVKVRIVVSQKSNNTQATAAFKEHYSSLLGAGAKIYEYPPSVVHSKIVVADGTVVFGTVNFDSWSLYRNYEISMMARSPAAAQLFEERVLTPLISKSVAGTPPQGIRSRIKDWFWDKLAYFL